MLKRGCQLLSQYKRFCTKTLVEENLAQFTYNTQCIPEPQFNVDYLCNPSNRDVIYKNIKSRKGIGDIDKVLELSKRPELKDELLVELSKIPNCTDPAISGYGDKPEILKICGAMPQFNVPPQEFPELATKLKLIKMASLGPITGQRSYILLGDLAELEEALVHYTIRKLMQRGFNLVSVPDIIPTKVIDRCGLIAEEGRNLVYNLDSSHGDNLSLSGTAEMSLAYKLMNNILPYEKLPLKLAAVSRCFRAETSRIADQKGIYRVHQFTKVEMFVCSEQEKSVEQFQELQAIQEELFLSLGLHFQIVDIPPHDLGAPAYRKVDMEAWMPGKKIYGEISSCSNCTDFQSRRLNIKYRTKDGNLVHVHTLNGTACAVPRMLIALCETYQTEHARIRVPTPLVPYMDGKTLIKKQPIAEMRVFKYKQKLC
ncbi:hypothetical protein KM043_006495 [Ampulex compressa]|nr:hypothetical protein KM043_006495 [Ampulex compressa]